MFKLLVKYKYKITYAACLAAALYLIFNQPLPFSPAADTLFEFSFIKFLVAVSLTGVGVYFRSKDIAQRK